jgi:hypothetical protein
LYQTTINDEKHNAQYVVSPNAKLYPDTTVMFADIKGFTEWSAPREPTQVFHLLETLYGGFDKLAKQHGVFKVETIGDTYVAVVGLPTSRKNHAMILAKFASGCLETMAILTRKLDETLGSVRFYIVSLPLEMSLKMVKSDSYVLSFTFSGDGRFIFTYWIELRSDDGRSLTGRKGSIPAIWRCKFVLF